jgi:carboxypeptidase family protein
MKTRNQLDSLRIASPCPTNWERMTGDDRVRHCDLCSLHVYNIAELSRSDAESLIANTEGRICARLFRRTDGTVITKDCPVGLRAIRRRVARVAGAAFATVLSLCGSVMGQKPNGKDKACQQQVKITKKIVDASAGDVVVTGVIQDVVGARVFGANISILNKKTGKSFEIVSDDEGRFASSGLSAGIYDIAIKANGFKNLELKDLSFNAKESVILEAILIVDEGTVMVGIISLEPMVDGSNPGNAVIMSGEKIRKLPIP